MTGEQEAKDFLIKHLKKILNALFIIIILFGLVLYGYASAKDRNSAEVPENYYAFTAEVFEIDGDSVIFRGEDGNCWEIFSDGFLLGDKYILVMSDLGTDDIRDDTIIDIISADANDLGGLRK